MFVWTTLFCSIWPWFLLLMTPQQITTSSTTNNKQFKYQMPTSKDSFAISLLGSSGCGKTSLVHMQLNNKFEAAQDETIWDTVCFTICFVANVYQFHVEEHIMGRNFSISLHDTSGSDMYLHYQTQWIESSHGFLLVYDLTVPDSLYKLKPIMDMIWQIKKQQCLSQESRNKYNLPIFPMVLVGNKFDLLNEDQKAEQYERATAFAKRYMHLEQDRVPLTTSKLPLIIFSSASFQGINVETAFGSIYQQVVQYKMLRKQELTLGTSTADVKGVQKSSSKRKSLFSLISEMTSQSSVN